MKKPTALETLLDLFPFLEHENWSSVYTLVYKITTEPYLQTFQYKIINRTINCRYNLQKWNKVSCSQCLYCPEIDTLEHHFYYCTVSKTFWSRIMSWLYTAVSVRVDLTVCEVLFGVISHYYSEHDITLSLNLILLLGKWYINRSKTNDTPLVLAAFVKLLKYTLKSIRMCYSLKVSFKNKFVVFYKGLVFSMHHGEDTFFKTHTKLFCFCALLPSNMIFQHCFTKWKGWLHIYMLPNFIIYSVLCDFCTQP